MNRELYLKYRRVQKKIRKLEWNIERLENFLDQYEKLYETEEAKEAIKGIKKYIKEKNAKLKELYPIYKKLDWQMYKECEHDIIINTSDEFPDHQHCLICGTQTVNWEGRDKNTKVFVLNFHTYNGAAEYFIKKFDEIVSKGEDPYDGFVDLVKKKGNKEVRILRRN